MLPNESTARPDRAALKQRLAGLSAAQRAEIARRIRPKSGAEVIGHAEPLRVEVAPTAADPARTIAVYPAGPGQLQMWFLQYYAPESPVYNIPQAFRIRGTLEVERLQTAIRGVIQRHGTLRTTFAMEHGRLVQRVASSSDFELEVIDLAQNSDDTAAGRAVEELACRAFDLVEEAQIRARLVRVRPDEHLLCVVIHHIVSDGWSQSNFFREVSALYAAALKSSDAQLTELPFQFADYSVWHAQRLQELVLREQTAYWKAKLAGTTEPLDLATDRPRSSVSSFRGGTFSVPIEPALLNAVQALAQREGATQFMVLLAGYQLLLHRYTGQNEVRVGVPIANRPRVETEPLIGYFVNTLVMRTSFTEVVTFRELLARVKTTAVEAYANSELAFERLVELFTDAPAADRAPLLQTLFSQQDFPETALSLPQLEVTAYPVSSHTSKMDFSIAVERSLDGWAANVEYNSDIFDAERMHALAGHWLVILKSVVANPGQAIATVPLLSETERDRILIEWNDTARDYPRDRTVHDLFAEQARRTPAAVALVCGDRSVSYGELEAASSVVAAHLRKRGVTHGDIVALRIERSAEQIIALLGILKAGGAYWSIEENLPEARVRTLLNDASPRLVLTREMLAECVVGDAESSDGAHIGSAEGAAYVSYTSGSTGRPKGVVVPHRAVVRLVKNVDYVALTPNETILHMAPLSFDASTFEIWGALLNGARLVLMPAGRPSLSDIGETIGKHGVTTAWLTAGLFHLMVDQRLDDLKPLRQLLAGGDVLSPEHVRKARCALPQCRIINGYGPTENTTFTCTYTVANEEALIANVPIGRPISNTRVYVLDAARQPVPVGVPGELYAGGDGVALGYLNQPELTAEKFIADPFSSEPGARLYRTGDRVRWRRDGNLEFIGRVDTEVKVRGYRVDLAEIEAALRECAGVRDAAVTRRDEDGGGHSLVAYVVPVDGAAPPNDSLREQIAALLPDYMVPSAFVTLSTLPISANGKVDRAALPAPERRASPAAHGPQASASLLERELTRLWQRLFHREDIGPNDNFFALGGHSLLATRLVAEIDDLLHCRLPIAALFQSPTIASLALRLIDEHWAPPWSSLVPLQSRGSRPPLFFTHGAGGDVYGFVWLVNHLSNEQPAYGLQAVGFDGKAPRHTTVEEMAAHYVAEIRSLQPNGPYHLAGFSMGGLIAFEIAQQLHRQGERVAFLGIIDTAPMSAPWPVYLRTLAPHLWERSIFHLQRWRGMPLRDRFTYPRRWWKALLWWTTQNTRKPRVITAPPEAGNNAPEVPGFYDYYWAVASAYKLERYPATIDYFASDSADPRFAGFWDHLARGGARVHRVPGTHLELVAPDRVQILGEALRIALEHAQAAGYGPSA